MASLHRDPNMTGILYENLFEITSLGLLLGAFICEVSKWFMLYSSVHSQALQQS